MRSWHYLLRRSTVNVHLRGVVDLGRFVLFVDKRLLPRRCGVGGLRGKLLSVRFIGGDDRNLESVRFIGADDRNLNIFHNFRH